MVQRRRARRAGAGACMRNGDAAHDFWQQCHRGDRHGQEGLRRHRDLRGRVGADLTGAAARAERGGDHRQSLRLQRGDRQGAVPEKYAGRSVGWLYLRLCVCVRGTV